jgi:Zn-finger nucleic acid-binding protein
MVQYPNCGGYWLDAGELAIIRAETNGAAVAERARPSSISADVIRYLCRLRTEQRWPEP